MFSIHCDPPSYFPQRGYRIKPTNNQKKETVDTKHQNLPQTSKYYKLSVLHLVDVTRGIGAYFLYLSFCINSTRELICTCESTKKILMWKKRNSSAGVSAQVSAGGRDIGRCPAILHTSGGATCAFVRKMAAVAAAMAQRRAAERRLEAQRQKEDRQLFVQGILKKYDVSKSGMLAPLCWLVSTALRLTTVGTTLPEMLRLHHRWADVPRAEGLPQGIATLAHG